MEQRRENVECGVAMGSGGGPALNDADAASAQLADWGAIGGVPAFAGRCLALWRLPPPPKMVRRARPREMEAPTHV